MSKKDVPNEKRRSFLKGATLAGAAALAPAREARFAHLAQVLELGPAERRRKARAA